MHRQQFSNYKRQPLSLLLVLRPKPQTRTADSPFPRVSFSFHPGPFSLAIARLLGRPGRNPTVEAAPSGMDQRRRAGSPNYGRQTVGGGGYSAPSSPAHPRAKEAHALLRLAQRTTRPRHHHDDGGHLRIPAAYRGGSPRLPPPSGNPTMEIRSSRRPSPKGVAK
ncbi:uncharacterized protein LOC109722739 isoform X2 [Ananas comosus]|uniref:Uncharacterized protein LOC109722739 isoform X2 n=1 Tax=Ananas comosus TaxID=4615 RepID=A0A6P5GF29_ANACO|nr:uncharacterized protein LOC109722739 isoform X2 [Ananas comosus]